MNSTLPRLGKKSLILLCCAFLLGYRSIPDLNSSSLSQKGKSFRNLNEGGLIGFAQDVVAPFLAALKSKFRDIDEEIQVVQITSSPTPSDIIGNATTVEGNNTTNSTGDERWCWWWCPPPPPTPAPTRAPTYFYTNEPEYLTSDVHCGRWYLFLFWSYQYNHIDYKLYNQDGTDFESEKSPGMQHDILEATKQSLTDYWQCREDNGHYDAFVENMHKRPYFKKEALFLQNVARITCMDACGGSVMCKDLTVPKRGDDCYEGDFQDILTDPDAKILPRFDYKIEYDVGVEADTEHQTYEYNVETLKSNPVQREKYGEWITSSISETEKTNQEENLKDLFKEWSLDVDEKSYNNYCDDIDEDGRTVECTVGRVSYIDVGKFELFENLFVYKNTFCFLIIYSPS